MMYKVLVDFYDLQDDGRFYRAGDMFPRDGLSVSDTRIKDLSTDANRLGRPVIAEVQEEKAQEEKPKATSRKRVKKDAD